MTQAQVQITDINRKANNLNIATNIANADEETNNLGTGTKIAKQNRRTYNLGKGINNKDRQRSQQSKYKHS